MRRRAYPAFIDTHFDDYDDDDDNDDGNDHNDDQDDESEIVPRPHRHTSVEARRQAQHLQSG